MNNLKRKVEALQKEFDSLIRRFYTATKPVPIDTLRVYINQRCVSKHQNIPLFEQGMSDIISQSTHEQVFILMSQIRAWNFLDYSLLRNIMEEFRIDFEFGSYAEKVVDFQRNTKLVDFLQVCNLPKECPAYYTTLIVKCTGVDENITLDEVSKRAALLAGEFNLRSLFASIGGAVGGCLYLLWYVPESVAKHMEKIMEGKDRPNLAPHGFQQLIIGEKIYNVSL